MVSSWTCQPHSQNSTHPSPTQTLPDTSVATPHYVPFPRPEKVKCQKTSCKRPIRIDTRPMTCSRCGQYYHKGCSGLNRVMIEAAITQAYSWCCEQCAAHQGDYKDTKGGMTKETSAQDRYKGGQKDLKLLQWNADGILRKFPELEIRAQDTSPDLIIIQETKLKVAMSTPTLKGYCPIRFDRVSNDGGGGLLFYIKDGVIFEHIGDYSRDGTEASTVRLRMEKRKWITITNVYCPPRRSHTSNVKLNLEEVITSPDSLTVGDFNAHSGLWDLNQPEDDRGETLLEWASSHDLTILNDGSPTRLNKSRLASEKTGGLSAPDVSICGATWLSKTSWKTSEAIGNSDHAPIEITINEQVKPGPIFKGQVRWKSNGVDWPSYTTAVEEAISDSDLNSTDLPFLLSRFNNTILEAATAKVGKTKPGKTNKPWVTPKVRSAIRNRNRLRLRLKTHRKEWVQACQEAQATIKSAKTEAWQKVLEDATTIGDDSKMWKTIKSLKGTPESNSPNEAMVHQGHLITSDKRKADLFVNHYARTSKLVMSKADRLENRRAKKMIRQKREEGKTERPFTLNELKGAITRMKSKGAAGPDGISPPLIKHLGPRALNLLLRMCNISLSSGTVPQLWKNATIIPLLKANKPPSELGSFRPISLTSCVGKVMERMLSERIYNLAETQGWWSEHQAGFRKGRGVEDQIIRVTQAVSDGFQEKKRTVMVLLDFSKAYDTVWRQRLLLSLADKGLPGSYVTWLADFLNNRQARVRFNGSLSRSKKITQGLPQGSVLAPILFLCYIDNLARIIPDNTTVAMYADDVSLLASSPSLGEAEKTAQQAVDTVVQWSEEWKIKLNGTKSEVAFFTLDTSQARWKPCITIHGKTISQNPHPKFLGVTLDCSLSFGRHVANTIKKATSKLRILGAVSNTTWGWRKEDLMKIFRSHILSVINFAGGGWQPWISRTNIQKLEAAQNKGLRLITGQGLSTPTEALRAEAGMCSMATQISRTCARTREKALRLPADHPRHRAFTTSVHRRLSKRKDARSVGEEITSQIPSLSSHHRTPLGFFEVPPWEKGLGESEVFPQLKGVKDKHEDLNIIQAQALKRALEIGATYNLYTDGSASGGTERGGAGVVVTRGDPNDPTVVATLIEKGSPLTSSYEEERRAMELAVGWVESHLGPSQSAAVFTDSQSLCMALAGPTPGLDLLRAALNRAKSRITIQWIPGHCNIPGNELADTAAKSATSLEGTGRGVSFSSACATIRHALRDPPIAHQRSAEVYSALSSVKEKEIQSRADQTLLAKIRSGKFTGLRAYKHLLDPGIDPTCNLCGEEPQDLEHWLQRCPATEAKRLELFGPDSGGLDCLTKHPRGAVALARSSLLGASSQ